MTSDIVITNARVHNLQGVDVRIPRNSLTVVTGLSGSGKSSLAFDTLYAEGQRRYVESLSAYARQFLGQMAKPDVERIEGLSPAIAIEQKTTSNNPRSIVATSTEIHDYLRLLYGHVARPHCPQCGRPVVRQSAEEIVNALLALPPESRLTLFAPVVRRRKGAQQDKLDEIRKAGFARIRLDGQLYDIDAVPPIDKKRNHDLDVVVDRVVVRPDARSRLADSVETALKRGDGLLSVLRRPPPGAGPEAAPAERLFSERNACPDCGLSFEELKPRNFSFNNPHGACPECSGLGVRLVFDEDLCVPDKSKPVREAVKAWRVYGMRGNTYYKYLLEEVCSQFRIDPDTPWQDLPDAQRDLLLHGSGDRLLRLDWRSVDRPFEGILPGLLRKYEESGSDEARDRLAPFLAPVPCPACRGARLRPESRAATVAGMSIVDLLALPVHEACAFFDALPDRLEPQERRLAADVVREIRKRLRFLAEVGLGYIALDRESSTLSGGEMQRIRLATQIGSGLVGVLYVLDEPTVGLHPRDNALLIRMLRRLQESGNTVVVVEHDADMIRAADYVVDLGPGAGSQGGRIVYQGPARDLPACAGSLTARYLSGEAAFPAPVRRKPSRERLVVRGAAANNLRHIDVSIPLGCFVCVTGVSGSGKSSLVDDILRKHLKQVYHRAREKPGPFDSISGLEYLDKVVEIDQSPIGRTPRSNPATYTDAFTLVRKLFAQTPAAKLRGYGPGRFSFNVKGGRCEACKGDGALRAEMHFLPDVYVTCEQCGGRRYNRETLQVTYAGKSIADVLDMPIDEAAALFRAVPPLAAKLDTLVEVGLGYVRLGQSSTTLSGGEAQRVKLAAELARRSTGRTLYLLDEPTTGLHFADVHRLLDLLFRLRDAGNTILMVEHNLDVIRCADYIIDLGPEGGVGGGRVVAAGTPEEIAACPASHTGKFLRS
jgi:excinuclease ABC subunit A